jgi:hypothetical protein
MKLYITLRSIPEFANLPKVEMRRKFRFYYLQALGHWLNWIPLALISMSFVILEWYIRGDFAPIQGKTLSIWYALLLRISLFIIDSIIYRVILYGTIAVYAKKMRL